MLLEIHVFLNTLYLKPFSQNTLIDFFKLCSLKDLHVNYKRFTGKSCYREKCSFSKATSSFHCHSNTDANKTFFGRLVNVLSSLPDRPKAISQLKLSW